jgi:hypothetical protein
VVENPGDLALDSRVEFGIKMFWAVCILPQQRHLPCHLHGLNLRHVVPPLFLSACFVFWLYSHAYAEAPCDEFTARLSNVKRSLCESANLQPSAAKSVNGRHPLDA